jgi:hypothetical protein
VEVEQCSRQTIKPIPRQQHPELPSVPVNYQTVQPEGQVTLKIPCEYFPVELTHNTQHTNVSFYQIFPFPQEPPDYNPEKVHQMIRLLLPSLKSLLENVERLATNDTIMQCLQSKQIMRIASDGGAIPGRASFGWII